jgi:TonB family protein
MTSGLIRLEESASRPMLAVSIALHGLLLAAVLLASVTVKNHYASSDNQIVTKVRLTELSQINRVSDPVQPIQVQHNDTVVQAEQSLEQIQPDAAETGIRQLVETSSLPQHDEQTIPVKKRSRKLATVDPPKPKIDKKPVDEKKSTKKDDKNRDYLEKRMANLRKAVEDKSKESSDSKPKSSSSNSQSQSSTPGGGESLQSDNGELLRWLQMVRAKINSRWTLPSAGGSVTGETIVGVKLADDGDILDTTVEESSGDLFFDKSAIRAVINATPFPPLPIEVKDRIRGAGGLALRFTAKGMQ